ncbi:EAL domain-containing protein [Croceicoccus sp. F390]|uniref:EAL domain-containing protein n=1 Tax=Croceicoccus esteveae TaxID=3075597 RepID=A0ABU2ZH11_9SPHN|nr:EAL domain-containing protein [Croceicoccus sp. F390]MDT0575891.1 EAL domain-containing protein [Croceicoccus sp. F390]
MAQVRNISSGEASLPQVKDRCAGCRDGTQLGFSFTMAFQPIVDLAAHAIWGYEALVRGPDGQSAASILEQVDEQSVYAFDQACRIKAIELAAPLLPRDGRTKLSINFKPNAVYEPAACIRATLNAARNTHFDRSQLMFEFTEDEQMRDVAHVRLIVDAYRKFGFTTAIDDFGAGHAGLTLLADLVPDVIKLDMSLIRNIESSSSRQIIVRSVAQMAEALGVVCLAEGLETQEEVQTVRALGIDLCQGYFFARPAINALPQVHFAV